MKRLSTLVWGEELLTLPRPGILLSPFFAIELASMSTLEHRNLELQNLMSHTVTRLMSPLLWDLLYLPGLDTQKREPRDGLLS